MHIDDIEIGQIVTVIGDATKTRVSVEDIDRERRLVTCSWFGGQTGKAHHATYRPGELQLPDKL